MLCTLIQETTQVSHRGQVWSLCDLEGTVRTWNLVWHLTQTANNLQVLQTTVFRMLSVERHEKYPVVLVKGTWCWCQEQPWRQAGGTAHFQKVFLPASSSPQRRQEDSWDSHTPGRRAKPLAFPNLGAARYTTDPATLTHCSHMLDPAGEQWAGHYRDGALHAAWINSRSIWSHLLTGNVCKDSLEDYLACPSFHSPEEERVKCQESRKQKIIDIGRQLSRNSELSVAFKVYCCVTTFRSAKLALYLSVTPVNFICFAEIFTEGRWGKQKLQLHPQSPYDLFTTGALWCS